MRISEFHLDQRETLLFWPECLLHCESVNDLRTICDRSRADSSGSRDPNSRVWRNSAGRIDDEAAALPLKDLASAERNISCAREISWEDTRSSRGALRVHLAVNEPAAVCSCYTRVAQICASLLRECGVKGGV